MLGFSRHGASACATFTASALVLLLATTAAAKPCNCLSPKKEAELRSLLVSEKKQYGARSEQAATQLIQLARNSAARQRFAGAEQEVEEALHCKTSSLTAAQALAAKGWILGEQKKYKAAASTYEDALVIRRSGTHRYIKQEEETAMQMQQLASIYQKLGQPAKASALLDEAVITMSRVHGPNHPLTKACRQIAAAARKH